MILIGAVPLSFLDVIDLQIPYLHNGINGRAFFDVVWACVWPSTRWIKLNPGEYSIVPHTMLNNDRLFLFQFATTLSDQMPKK
jgi:hypothetical protein